MPWPSKDPSDYQDGKSLTPRATALKIAAWLALVVSVLLALAAIYHAFAEGLAQEDLPPSHTDETLFALSGVALVASIALALWSSVEYRRGH